MPPRTLHRQFAVLRNSVLKTTDVIVLAVLLVSLLGFLPFVPQAHAAGTFNAHAVTLGSPTPGVSTNGEWSIDWTNSTTTQCSSAEVCSRFKLTFNAVDAVTNGISFDSAYVSSTDVTFTGLPMNTVFTSSTLSKTNVGLANPNVLTLDVFGTGGAGDTFFGNATTITISITNSRIVVPAKVAGEGIADMYGSATEASILNGSIFPVYEVGSAQIAINDQMTVSATVNTMLSFVVSGLAFGTVNDEVITEATTAIACPFGVLTPNVAKVCAQELAVQTNAPFGYFVYITQSGNMISGIDMIASFRNGEIISGTGETWNSPDSITYTGHLGVTSEVLWGSAESVTNANCGPSFTETCWLAIPDEPNATERPVTIGWLIDGSQATTDDVSRVGFKIEVGALQPAGLYSNTITYSLVPQY